MSDRVPIAPPPVAVPPTGPPAGPAAGDARILERGYRRYDGPRLGRGAAVRSVMVHAVQRVLGLHRAAWAKVLPVLTIAIAYIPAIVFVGITALTPDDPQLQRQLPTYGEYYGYIVSAIVVFVAFVGPEALCPDRRSGMLGLYLASPLDRTTYLLGKAWAVANVLATVSLGPPLLMMLAFSLQGHGPSGIGDTLSTLLHIVLAGCAITAFYTALSLGVSSLTERKGFASAGIIIAIVLSAAISGVLQSSGSDGARVVNLFLVPFDLANRIHHDPLVNGQLGTGSAVAAWAGWTVFGAALTWVRYQRLEVTR